MGSSARTAAAAVSGWLRGELGRQSDPSFEAEETHESDGDVVLLGTLTRDGRPARVGLHLRVRGGEIDSGTIHLYPAEALRVSGLDATTGRNVALVRRHYDAFNRADLDTVAATLHPQVELFGGDERGGAGERYSGRDDAMKFFTEVKRLVTDNTIDVLSLEASPGRVEASVRLRGTLRDGELSGSLPAVHFFEIHDELIARIETYRPDWRSVI